MCLPKVTAFFQMTKWFYSQNIYAAPILGDASTVFSCPINYYLVNDHCTNWHKIWQVLMQICSMSIHGVNFFRNFKCERSFSFVFTNVTCSLWRDIIHQLCCFHRIMFYEDGRKPQFPLFVVLPNVTLNSVIQHGGQSHCFWYIETCCCYLEKTKLIHIARSDVNWSLACLLPSNLL